MKMNGMGEKYPRPWTIDDEPTNYMAFPILPGQRIWTGGEPGRFRIVYNKFDGSFYRVVMHRYTTPLSERESTSLGFCWVGEKCGHESSHSHFGSTSPFAKSSHEYPFSPDDIGPHPLRQNPPELESPLVATKQVNNVKSPTHESDPCFVHATVEPEDIPSSAESRRPSLGNRLVKSPPSTPRRFSNVLSPPQSQRTMLVKSPPVRSRSNAIQSLPLGSDPGPVILSPSSRSISNNIQSPAPSTYTPLPKSTPTVSRHLSIIPSPEIDQENRFVKSPPLPPRRTSVVQSPHDGYDPRLPRSPRLASKSFSSIHSPAINQDSPFIKSPPMTPMTPQAYSNMHSPTMGYDPGLQRSPRISYRPFNSGQSPILEEETPVKSLKVGIRPSRSFQSPVLGQRSSPYQFTTCHSDNSVDGPRSTEKSFSCINLTL